MTVVNNDLSIAGWLGCTKVDGPTCNRDIHIMCIYIYLCVWKCSRVWTYRHVYVYGQLYECAYVWMCVHSYAYMMHVCMCMQTCTQFMYASTYALMYVCNWSQALCTWWSEDFWCSFHTPIWVVPKPSGYLSVAEKLIYQLNTQPVMAWLSPTAMATADPPLGQSDMAGDTPTAGCSEIWSIRNCTWAQLGRAQLGLVEPHQLREPQINQLRLAVDAAMSWSRFRQGLLMAHDGSQ